MDLARAIDIAVRGEFPPEHVLFDNHHFMIRAISGRNLLEGDETGYFRHEHVGKDDRVFFSIKVNGPDSYVAKLSRIEYRGIFGKFGTKKINLPVNGAGDLDAAAEAVIGIVGRFVKGFNPQSHRDGNWELAAAKIIDRIGHRMAQIP